MQIFLQFSPDTSAPSRERHLITQARGAAVSALIAIGFFVCGPQILVGVASADFSSKKAIGTANKLYDIIKRPNFNIIIYVL